MRSIKSRSNGRKRQAEHNGNGYDQLEGEWLTYYKVASRFSHKAQAQDREDLLHDIIITLADVERNNGHKPFTEVAMYRIASFTVADYWRANTSSLMDWSAVAVARRKDENAGQRTYTPSAQRLSSWNTSHSRLLMMTAT